MSAEKNPAGRRGVSGTGQAPFKNKKTLSERRGRCNRISFYSQGVDMYAHPIIRTGGDNGGVRGEIKGWSSASRRRMREFMLTHEPVEGLHDFGVTLTIPGPVLPADQAKEIFEDFAREMQKEGMGAVWRVEIQQRGMLHWHLRVASPSKHPSDITELWWGSIRKRGPEIFNPPHEVGTMRFEKINNRMCLPGADLRACQVEMGGGRGSWLRYLQDHASKGKQEQIAVNIGRHWGVIGRKCFQEIAPLYVADMTDKEYFRALRWLQRLATPSFPSRCVFGRKLGDRVRRGSRGRSVWYSRPETVKRLVGFAMREDQ